MQNLSTEICHHGESVPGGCQNLYPAESVKFLFFSIHNSKLAEAGSARRKLGRLPFFGDPSVESSWF
jgi:hypothetical protein